MHQYLIKDPNASGTGDPFSGMNITVEEMNRFIGGQIAAYDYLNNITTLFTCTSNLDRN